MFWALIGSPKENTWYTYTAVPGDSMSFSGGLNRQTHVTWKYMQEKHLYTLKIYYIIFRY